MIVVKIRVPLVAADHQPFAHHLARAEPMLAVVTAVEVLKVGFGRFADGVAHVEPDLRGWRAQERLAAISLHHRHLNSECLTYLT